LVLKTVPFRFYSAAGILPFITVAYKRWPALRGNRFNPLRSSAVHSIAFGVKKNGHSNYYIINYAIIIAVLIYSAIFMLQFKKLLKKNTMPFETRFTEEEQVLLSSLPALAGSAMTFAAGSGLATVKEVIASSKSMILGAKSYADNEIISGIIPAMDNVKEAMAEAKDLRAKLQGHLAAHEVKTKEQMHELALADAKKINELLAQKATPAEAEQYKAWILNIANEVANAAKEGGFLGFGGTLVSEGEVALFGAMSSALGVSSKMA
jgi:hypothetical protein